MGTHVRRAHNLNNEEEAKWILEQRNRARKERLLQVRHQDALLAAARVREFRARVASGQQKLSEQLEAQWRVEHQTKVQELEAELAAALADVGRSQLQARHAVQEKAKRAGAAAVQAAENLRHVQARFQDALKEENIRRDALLADHRAAEARRKALEDAMQMERAVARIAAQNAELRRRAEEAAASAREPRALPTIDSVGAFRCTYLHRELLERAPLTNIPGAENAPPQRVEKFPSQDVHIKGLDDSGVAAEVERRRIEAERERRQRERREGQSRTDEREAAAHFRLSIWRQRKEAAVALAQARRAEQRAFSADGISITPLVPARGSESAHSHRALEGGLCDGVPAVPADQTPAPGQSRPDELRKASASEGPAPVPIPTSPETTQPQESQENKVLRLPIPEKNAEKEGAASDGVVREGGGVSSASNDADPSIIKLAPEVSQSTAESERPAEKDASSGTGAYADGGSLLMEGTGAYAGGGSLLMEGIAASTDGDSLLIEGTGASTDGGGTLMGGPVAVGPDSGSGGWLPRIGENSPFEEQRWGRDLRRPLAQLVNQSIAEQSGAVERPLVNRNDSEEGMVAVAQEHRPENPEEGPVDAVREALEELMALESPGGEGRESGRRSIEAMQTLGESGQTEVERGLEGFGRAPQEGRAEGQTGRAPRNPEGGGDELRQSLEEFIALERELYEKEQQKERLRGRLEDVRAVDSSRAGGGFERPRVEGLGRQGFEGRHESAGLGKRGKGRSAADEGGSRFNETADDGQEGRKEAEADDVARAEEAPLVGQSVNRDAAEAANLGAGRWDLEVATARRAPAFLGFDYASSDLTLTSSPMSGLSPFSLLTSPLSGFSEDDLDGFLEDDLRSGHVSSFEGGHVAGLGGIRARLEAAVLLEPLVMSGDVVSKEQQREAALKAEGSDQTAKHSSSQSPGQTPNQPSSQSPGQTPNQTSGESPGQTPDQTSGQTSLSRLMEDVMGGSATEESWSEALQGVLGENSPARKEAPGLEEPASENRPVHTSSSLDSSGLSSSLFAPAQEHSVRTSGREDSSKVPSSDTARLPSSVTTSGANVSTTPTENTDTTAGPRGDPSGSNSSSQRAPLAGRELLRDPGSSPGVQTADFGEAVQSREVTDDIFARLKRELDEFDERLDAVRADVFAQGGQPPSTSSGS